MALKYQGGTGNVTFPFIKGHRTEIAEFATAIQIVREIDSFQE